MRNRRGVNRFLKSEEMVVRDRNQRQDAQTTPQRNRPDSSGGKAARKDPSSSDTSMIACGLTHDTGHADGLHERDVHVDRRTGDLAGQHEPEPHIHHYKAASQQNALSDKLGMFDQRADAEKTGKRKGHIKKNDDERRPVGRRPRLGQAGIDDEKILHADGRDICQPKRQALKIRKHGSLSPFAPAPGTMP